MIFTCLAFVWSGKCWQVWKLKSWVAFVWNGKCWQLQVLTCVTIANVGKHLTSADKCWEYVRLSTTNHNMVGNWRQWQVADNCDKLSYNWQCASWWLNHCILLCWWNRVHFLKHNSKTKSTFIHIQIWKMLSTLPGLVADICHDLRYQTETPWTCPLLDITRSHPGCQTRHLTFMWNGNMSGTLKKCKWKPPKSKFKKFSLCEPHVLIQNFHYEAFDGKEKQTERCTIQTQ